MADNTKGTSPDPNPELLENQEDDIAHDFFSKGILKLGHLFSLLFILSMAILIFEVVMRYIFDSPTIWVHETTIFLCAICFLFGGLHSVSRNGHIRVVLLYDAIGPKTRRWLDIFIYATCAIACGIFSYSIWPTVISSFWTPSGEFRMITSGSAWNPPFPTLLRLFLFITLLAMTIQFAIFAVKNLIRSK